ncbi:MAG: undecaprenyl-diphosphate phosphatase [Saccharolobus sp.]
MNPLYSILIGIVQGISEWLPISSKTQVLLTSEFLLGISVTVAYTFGLFMEMGSIGSAAIYFRNDIREVLRDKNLLLFLVIVTLFTGLVGVPLYILSEKVLSTVSYNAGIPMLILGIALIIDGIYIKYSRNKIIPKNSENVKLRDMIIIGIAQGLAALPGVSRSGITVSTMLFLGYSPENAFRYSYLAYIPASLGAVGTTLLFTKHNINEIFNILGYEGILLAVFSSLVIGIITISFLLKIAKKSSVYVIDFILGIIAITFSSLLILIS